MYHLVQVQSNQPLYSMDLTLVTRIADILASVGEPERKNVVDVLRQLQKV